VIIKSKTHNGEGASARRRKTGEVTIASERRKGR